MADTLASVVIQDLTYTARRHGQSILISYLNGGVAGAETVTVLSNHIRVTMASGTSTATQMKAAIERNGDATALVSVTISGTAGDAQVTCNSASLSGGHAVTTATITVQDTLLLTADASGTGGNAIRFRFTSGATAGSEVVTVSTNDISVQIEDGVSTFAQIKTALDNSVAASALITPTFVGPSTSTHALVASMSTYQNLSGGSAATAPTTVVQDLTIAADATGTAANGKTYTYTVGATAGAEVVTVTSGNINVQIENGVSTATQIETALNAETDFTSVYNVTVTGTGSTPQLTVNSEALTDEETMSTKDYYSDETIIPLTANFEAQYFHFHARTIVLENDETSGSDTVEWSFDGSTVGGILEPGQSITLDKLGNGTAVISLRSAAAADYHLNVIGV